MTAYPLVEQRKFHILDGLLEKGGTYRELYETQFRQILDREKKDA